MSPAPKRVYHLPPGAIFTSLPDDFLTEVLYPCLTNQTIGRISRAAKRFRNALLHYLRERMIEFVKVELLPSHDFKWRPLVAGHDDIRVYKAYNVPGRDYCRWTKDEDMSQEDRKGLALVESSNSTPCELGYPLRVSSVMNVSYYGFDCFKGGHWRHADPGRRDNFDGTDEEWLAEVARCKESTFYKIEYAINPSAYVDSNSLTKDPDPLLYTRSLSKALKIHKYLILDRWGKPCPPKIVHERDSNYDHSCPRGGSVYRLSSMKLPGIRQLQSTSEVLVDGGHTIWLVFNTEFGKVTTSTYMSNEIGHRDNLKAILHRFLGGDGPALSDESLSNSSLDEHGSINQLAKRYWFTGLSVEMLPMPKVMGRVGNTSNWRQPFER